MPGSFNLVDKLRNRQLSSGPPGANVRIPYATISSGLMVGTLCLMEVISNADDFCTHCLSHPIC